MAKSETSAHSHFEKKDIFHRLQASEPMRLNDPEYPKIQAVVDRTLRLSAQLNASTNVEHTRKLPGEITGTTIDETTTIFTACYVN